MRGLAECGMRKGIIGRDCRMVMKIELLLERAAQTGGSLLAMSGASIGRVWEVDVKLRGGVLTAPSGGY